MADDKLPKLLTTASDLNELQELDIRSEDGLVDKLLGLLWKHKENSDLIKEILLFFESYFVSKDVIEQIEFYLPQIVHIVILSGAGGLGVTPQAVHFRKFVISLCRLSTNIALQLNFYTKAYLEDYQPELSTQLKNPHFSLKYFTNCYTLLDCIEKTVVFHRIEESSESIRYDEVVDGNGAGCLYFKRDRRKPFHTKHWKWRYFIIECRQMLCYKSAFEFTPRMSISLINCEVMVINDHPKYGNTCFDIFDYVLDITYHLRAQSAEIREKWINSIEAENRNPPRKLKESDIIRSIKVDMPSKRIIMINEDDCLSAEEAVRFHQFKQEHIFVTNMTNICERLRFKERPLRKHFLIHYLEKMSIPRYVYLPVCGSTDKLKTVRGCFHEEAYAFRTKARCPSLMLFETEEQPQGDITSFLSKDLQKIPKTKVISKDADVQWLHQLEASEKLRGSESTAILDKESRKSASVDIGPEDSFFPFDTSVEIWESTEDVSTDSIQLSVSVNSGSPNPFFGETFEDKVKRLKSKAKHKDLPGWGVEGIIAKSNDDLRQEVFVMQMIQFYKNIFQHRKISAWLYTYKIISTSQRTGLIELIPNTISLDALKKSDNYPGSLKKYFDTVYTTPAEKDAALEAYVTSMAGYSIVCWLLAIKDRHNGNIMINRTGHILHIDFGFVFGLAPGKAFSMEKAPWKLTKEMVEVMGGRDSKWFKRYRDLCVECFLVARENYEPASKLFEILVYESNYPAFKYNPNALRDFKQRYLLDYNSQQIGKWVDKMMDYSYDHWGTRYYDQFQLLTNEILP